MKESSKLSKAIEKTRAGSLNGLEELYLLSYKDTYADIRFSVEDEEYIWNIIRDVYIQVYERHEGMPEESLLRQWLRILIKEVARKKEGVTIENFPDIDGEADASMSEAIEPKANTTLISIEEQLGLLDKDYEDVESPKKAKHVSLKMLGALLLVVVAVAMVIWVMLTMKDDKSLPVIGAALTFTNII